MTLDEIIKTLHGTLIILHAVICELEANDEDTSKNLLQLQKLIENKLNEIDWDNKVIIQ